MNHPKQMQKHLVRAISMSILADVDKVSTLFIDVLVEIP